MPRGVRLAGRVLLWISPIILLSTLAAIILYVRLLQGPVSLKILAGPVERGITDQLDGLSAKVDDMLLRRSSTGAYAFELVNLRLIQADGGVVASAPVAAVSLNLARLALLEVQPQRIELVEPRVSVSYSARDGLALSFTEVSETQSDDPPQPVPTVAADKAAGAQPEAAKPSGAFPGVLRKLDLARIISEYSARARRQQDASAGLTQFGFRNAIVDVDYEGSRSSWKVAELTVDLDHKSRRSIISAAASIESDRGPWSVSLLTEDSEKTGTLMLKASVRDLVPSMLGRALPGLALLRAIDLPTAGNASIRFQSSGELNSADIAVEVGRGQIDFGAAMAAPLLIDAGLFNFNYDAATERLTLAPSTLRWGGSAVSLAGLMVYDGANAASPNWAFDVRSVSGSVGADEFKVTPVQIDKFGLSGRFVPSTNHIELTNVVVEADGGSMAFSGDIVAGDASVAGARIDGRFGPANANAVKAFWPRMMAPRARQWFGDHLNEGLLREGTIHFKSGALAPPGSPIGPKGVPENVVLDLTGENVILHPVQGGPPLTMPAVTVAVRNQGLEITTPDAVLATKEGAGVALRQGRFSVANIDAAIADAEMAFKAQAPLGSAIEAVTQLKLLKIDRFAIPPEKIQGKLDGEFSIRLPLLPEIEPDTVAVTGKAKITDVKSQEKIGVINLQSGAVDLLMSPTDASAKGELILNGVLAKLDWRRQTPAGAAAVTSPLTLSANLDNSDRRQLGIDVSDFVDGEVPTTIAFDSGEANSEAASSVRVTADLSPADFSISPLAWKKPRGQPAKVEFDVVTGTVYKTELRNFKISGDTIAAEGWVGLSADQKVQEFSFPAVSLNTVSRIGVSGKRGARDILDVRVDGSTFDGKDFFRSLFTSGSTPSKKAAAKKGGVDVTANFETVLGYSGTNLRNFSMRLSKRGDDITALDARGKLDNGKALIAILQAETNGKRKIIADTTDAGQSLRLVGFYPNMQGGRGRIDLFLDGEDKAQTAGVLIIEDFKVLGDPIVSEVVSSAAGDGPAIGASTYGQRKVVREIFEFDRMRLPFNVGYGQFAIEDSYLRGPLLGATLRGKVDYTNQKVDLGGTYIPLQGLNNALGGIPVLGQILSGPRGEGIFGITFAVEGSMSNPQVIVNPLSIVAPGIFREMFQMTNSNNSVQPRAPSPANVPIDKRVRASSSGGTTQGADSVDGWSSDTVVPSKKN
jgi:AsmA-like C-terminal region